MTISVTRRQTPGVLFLRTIPLVSSYGASLALVQVLALATMLIDHLGAVGILGDWSRVVGRFALPAFVMMIAANALLSSAPGRMLTRLVLLLFISQFFWSFTVGSFYQLCILVTLFFVVMLIHLYRVARYDYCLLVLGVFILLSPFVEYGFLPLLLVPVVLSRHPLALVLALVWPWLQYPGEWFYCLSALFSLCVIIALCLHPVSCPRVPRWLSRWFYPGHLIGIAYWIG